MSETYALSGNIVDVIGGRIYPGTVEVVGGRIARLTPDEGSYDSYLLPGFVDAHVHIESSMLVPSEFARLAVRHGTVASVSDPHEIANVLGLAGVEYMIENGRATPFKFFFGAPSCVPATAYETAGAEITPAQVGALLARDEVKYLAEMMNYPGVLGGDPDVCAKTHLARALGKPVDGHAPGLRGAAARSYFAAGITTDHECVTREEAEDKLACGAHILIREGSAAKNFDALFGLIETHPERCMFCSDDKHPNDLERGHIDELVRRAVAGGVGVMKALRAACVNPVLHYGLDVGLLRVGDAADFIEVGDLVGFRALRTYIGGRLVAEGGRSLLPHRAAETLNNFHASPKTADDFRVEALGDRLRVIETRDGALTTRASWVPALVRGGEAQADPAQDVLKIALVNRYRDAPPAVGFVRGFGLTRGALASSVAHDSHNIVAVGVTDEDLCQAVNAVIQHRGGLGITGGGVAEVLPLPVAGLMSGEDGFEVARQYEALDRAAKALGSPLSAPFMTLSFMALLVIPSLKMSDLGLFDADRFRLTGLFS